MRLSHSLGFYYNVVPGSLFRYYFRRWNLGILRYRFICIIINVLYLYHSAVEVSSLIGVFYDSSSDGSAAANRRFILMSPFSYTVVSIETTRARGLV